MLKAAEFDKTAWELLEYADRFRDPAAMIPRRFAELDGANSRLEKQITDLRREVRQLTQHIHALNETIDRMGAAQFREE